MTSLVWILLWLAPLVIKFRNRGLSSKFRGQNRRIVLGQENSWNRTLKSDILGHHRAAIASASRSALADSEHMQRYYVRACTRTYTHGKRTDSI